MKKTFLVISILLLLFPGNPVLAFDSGSTGADSALSPTENTEIELPADGIFNFTTVNIPEGVTVTFTKNNANTPVYILATGDVTIAGKISVNGAAASGSPGNGGNGAYNGGMGGSYKVAGGKGQGPGGGNPGSVSTNVISSGSSGGGGGGFGSKGSDGGGSSYAPPGTGGSAYGNTKIIPMTGGSGGGGGAGSINSSYPDTGGAGGGGGGAIMIASSSTITVAPTGSITAMGGKGGTSSNDGNYAGDGGGGSAGAIKLMADTISVEGTISATGGGGGNNTNGYDGGAGGKGRIRVEANELTNTFSTSPPYTYGYPGAVFVTNIPALSITSIGGVSVPANPAGQYGLTDITLPSGSANPVTVEISATNIPVGTEVTVTSIPEYGASTSAAGSLSGADEASTASVSITLSTTYQSVLMAEATYSVRTAMYYDNEKIEKVRVAAITGGKSGVVYITEKGREISGVEMMAGLR